MSNNQQIVKNEFRPQMETPKSSFPRSRSRRRKKTAEQLLLITTKNKPLYNQLRKLMIQKRKIIKMRLDITRLEGQVRREKDIREIRGKETSAHDGVLLKKLRATAKKEQLERQMFLNEFSKRDWKKIISNSPDKVNLLTSLPSLCTLSVFYCFNINEVDMINSIFPRLETKLLT